MIDKPILAVVVPVFNEEDILLYTISRLNAIVTELVRSEQISTESFLYFVDDGSSDRSWEILKKQHETVKQVRALKLSRNFGHQNALLAALTTVKDRCDISISIDADLQQDVMAISHFIAKFKAGSDIVFGIRNDRAADSFMKKTSAELYYCFLRSVGVEIIANHADYRLLSRKAMEALSKFPEPNLFLRAVSKRLGFKHDVVHFDVEKRMAGKSKYTVRKMLKLAITGITSFTVFPLRLVSVVGVVIFFLSILMAAYILVRTLVSGDTVPGWASTTLPIYFIGGVQILCLGVIGEYIAQIAEGVKNRPRYILDEEIF